MTLSRTATPMRARAVGIGSGVLILLNTDGSTVVAPLSARSTVLSAVARFGGVRPPISATVPGPLSLAAPNAVRAVSGAWLSPRRLVQVLVVGSYASTVLRMASPD